MPLPIYIHKHVNTTCLCICGFRAEHMTGQPTRAHSWEKLILHLPTVVGCCVVVLCLGVGTLRISTLHVKMSSDISIWQNRRDYFTVGYDSLSLTVFALSLLQCPLNRCKRCDVDVICEDWDLHYSFLSAQCQVVFL